MRHAAAGGIAIAAIALGWTFTGCARFGEAAPVSEPTDAASRPCASAHLFCDDFDEGNDNPSTRWDDITSGAGPIAVIASDSVSAPRSLRVSLTSGSGSRMTTIEKRVATTRADITVGFDFRVATPSSQDFGAISFATIALVPAPAGETEHGVTLYQYGDSQPQVAYYRDTREGRTDTKSDLDPNVAFGRWQRVTFEISGGAAPKVSVRVDGSFAGAVEIAPVALTGVDIRLGLDTAEARTTTTVHYDNVTVDEE